MMHSLTMFIFLSLIHISYEQEVRRAEERVLVDRVMWLASGSPNPQVRAEASLKLQMLGARQVAAPEAERAQRLLLSADIKRRCV